jgi:hypothetical protein
MANDQQWHVAFARQALSDKQVYDYLCENKYLDICQGLHFLQMTFEKLCKAHLLAPGNVSQRPDNVFSSHSVIAKQMPRIYMKFCERHNITLKSWEITEVRILCKNINELSPSVGSDENCEYPWEKNFLFDDDTFVVAPVEHEFAVANEIKRHIGTKLLKCLSALLNEMVKVKPA